MTKNVRIKSISGTPYLHVTNKNSFIRLLVNKVACFASAPRNESYGQNILCWTLRAEQCAALRLLHLNTHKKDLSGQVGAAVCESRSLICEKEKSRAFDGHREIFPQRCRANILSITYY